MFSFKGIVQHLGNIHFKLSCFLLLCGHLKEIKGIFVLNYSCHFSQKMISVYLLCSLKFFVSPLISPPFPLSFFMRMSTFPSNQLSTKTERLITNTLQWRSAVRSYEDECKYIFISKKSEKYILSLSSI